MPITRRLLALLKNLIKKYVVKNQKVQHLFFLNNIKPKFFKHIIMLPNKRL